MPFGTQVCLDLGNIVLDGDPAPPSRKVAQPPIFGPRLLWPNGWMDQVPLCKEVDLGPGHIVLDGDPVGTQHPPPYSSPSSLFGPCLLCPNGRPSQQLLSSCSGRPTKCRYCRYPATKERCHGNHFCLSVYRVYIWRHLANTTEPSV